MIDWIVVTGVKFVLLVLGTVMAFKLIDLLTPMIPFREVGKTNPWIIVILITTAMICVTILLSSGIQLARLVD